jgi:dipeptidyl aminopeptidase/acylaminoacyl peptidase
MALAFAGPLPVVARTSTPGPALSPVAPAPVEAYAALPQFVAATLSPDGKTLAYGATDAGGDHVVMVVDLATRAAQRIELGGNSLNAIVFDDGGELIVAVNDTVMIYGDRYELLRHFVVDRATKAIRMLLNADGGPREMTTGSAIVGLLPDGPGEILMQTTQPDSRGRPTLNLYRVALAERRETVVAWGEPSTYAWMADEAGKPVLRADHDGKARVTTLHIREGDNWREALRMEATGTPGVRLSGFDRRGRALIIRDLPGQDAKLEALDLTTGRLSASVRTEGGHLEGTVVDPWTGRMLGVGLAGLEPQVAWLDPDMVALQATLQAALDGQDVDILHRTRDMSRVLVSAAPRGAPATLHLFEPAANRLTALGPTMPTLAGRPHGRIEARTFETRDGVDLPVYVTLPPGMSEARGTSVVIFPHGGPEARDWPRFDWWAQFMASRGHVVIQPQFRGSDGFGKTHADAGRRQWGRRMQDDVTDALAWAVAEGMVDPKRACIVGGSYGGYAALAGATLTPDLYACAIAVAGVSDLELMMRQTRTQHGRKGASTNYWRDHIGADDVAGMRAVSPRRLARQVRAPVLLLHGADDTVVEPEQSRVMERALREAGKPVRFVALQAEDHWLSRAQTRLQMLQEIEAFLATHLGAAPRSGPANPS